MPNRLPTTIAIIIRNFSIYRYIVLGREYQVRLHVHFDYFRRQIPIARVIYQPAQLISLGCRVQATNNHQRLNTIHTLYSN